MGKVHGTHPVTAAAFLLAAAVAPAAPGRTNDSGYVRLRLQPASERLLIGDRAGITLRAAVRLPPGTLPGAEPLDPANPPRLEIPYLEPGVPGGMRGPDIRTLLRPWLSADPRRPAMTLNAIGIDAMTDSALDPSERANSPELARFRLNRSRTVRDGHIWVEYVVAADWLAESYGTHHFGPVVFTGRVAATADEHGRFSAWRDVTAISETVAVQVLPAPRERPAFFFGADGETMTADLEIEPQTCNLGDPVLLRLRIDGDLFFDRMTPPRLETLGELTSLFEIHAETMRARRSGRGIEFEVTVRPIFAGTLEVPALNWPWFNRTSWQYEFATSRPLPIRVLPAAGIPAASPTAGVPAAAGYRTDENGWLTRKRRPDGIALSMAALGPLQYLLFSGAALLLSARRRHRHRRCLRDAGERLRRSLSHLADDSRIDPAAAARAIRSAVADYCRAFHGARIAPGAMENPWRDLAKHAPRALPPPAFRDAFARCLQVCFTSRPAPVAGLHDDIAVMLENVPDFHPPATPNGLTTRAVIGPAAALLALGWLASVWRPGGDDFPKETVARTHRYLWEEANALATGAGVTADPAAARARYRELMDAGVRNAALYYNYGVVCLETADYAAAVSALRRSVHMDGRARDTLHNLRLARAGLAAGPASSRARFRSALPVISPGMLQRAAAGVFLAAWLALTILRTRTPPRSAARVRMGTNGQARTALPPREINRMHIS